jgi:DNA topoisomerase-1
MSGKRLVIVESPAKCGKIESYLGTEYKCMASFGHIRELTGLTSIDIKNGFNLSFSNMSSKSKQITALKKAAKESVDVIIATDDDREGEAIGWHLCMVLNLPIETTKRILFNEITAPALQKAIKSPTVLNMNLVMAQQARQTIDMMVGYMISPVLWNQIARKSKKGLSAGRCQTPALRLVYDNQKEIENAPGEKVYNTTGYFTSKNLPFQLDKQIVVEEEVESFLEDSVNHSHEYNCSNPKDVTKNPPSPFSTSALQQTASTELRYSPKDTMKLCQTLYEAGYITYMRTDSKTYSKEFLTLAHKYIDKKYGTEYVGPSGGSTKGKKPKKKTPVASQEAHEAIRPTKIERVTIPDSMSPKERKMYSLIWRNTIESCMSVAKCRGITALITAPQNCNYKYSAEQIVFPGWKIVSLPNCLSEVDPIYTLLNTIKPSTILDYHRITSKSTLKNLKQHYTEAKLVQLLEEKGIGRPSTFSSLIDKIQEREYVKKTDVKGKSIKCSEYELVGEELTVEETSKEFGNEKNKLVVQSTGTLVIEMLVKHFDLLFAYGYTSEMESSLDDIAKGKTTYETLCGECHEKVQSLIDALPKAKCKDEIQIDSEHTFMIGKYGPVVKRTVGKETRFVPIRKDIDMDKLRRGDYTMDELRVDQIAKGKFLGTYNEKEVILRKGKFGLYLQYGDQTKSLKNAELNEANLTLEDVIRYLDTEKDPSVLRILDKRTSIRNGKYGHYVYFKTPDMKRPRFIPTKTYPGDYLKDSVDIVLEWLDTHVSL